MFYTERCTPTLENTQMKMLKQDIGIVLYSVVSLGLNVKKPSIVQVDCYCKSVIVKTP